MSTTFENILKNISDNYDKSDGSFVYDLSKSISYEFENHKAEIENILVKTDVENLAGDELTRFVYQRTGLPRKQATYATTYVTITGSPLATVNKGDLVSADDIIYEVVENTILSAEGSAQVFVQCQIAGSVGNVPANQINTFPLTLSGIVSVTNESNVTNGYDEEADEDLRERYYEKLQKPGKAGNKYHYLEWAKSVLGVGKAKVFPRWEGPLTVKVSILDSNITIANPELIESVKNYIESQKPFGANVTVTTGTELKINISLTLTYDSSYLLESLKDTIKDKINEYFKSIAYTSDTISHAMIGREILSIEGVIDYQDLTLNGEAKNIKIEEEQVPVVGEMTVNE